MNVQNQNLTSNNQTENLEEKSIIIQIPSNVNSNQHQITLNQITNSINELSKELIFLSKKRNNSIKQLPSYNNFLSTFYHKSSINNENNIQNKENNFNYLTSAFEDFVFGKFNKTISNEKKLKIIGITPEDIYTVPKYKINFKKLPKFGKISDYQIYNNSFNDRQNSNLFFKRKINNNYSIEKQNNEKLKLIEQRRQKYKNISKSSKEKMDNNRLKKYWDDLSKHEIPKCYRLYLKTKNENEALIKKILILVEKEVKQKKTKEQKIQRECFLQSRKIQREIVLYWKRKEKENVDNQKKKEKIEQELQEQILQKKRMEYLLKQSDIYSLMMYKKLGAFMPQENNNENDNENKNENNKIENKNFKEENIAGKNILINTKTNKIVFQSIKVDVDVNKAKEEVNNLILAQKQKAAEFDQNLNVIRKTLGGEEVKIENINKKEIENEINEIEPNKNNNDDNVVRLDKPMINNSSSQLLETPKSFIGELKEYQLKGLRWLDNLFEQGINGILADEMGLGKTIQVISFLAHLSLDKNNWGPFLVIAPNSTLYNWQQELNRFCPSLKVLPYWGALRERKMLRKLFNTSQLYVKNSSFHVCITSYQLVVCDEKVFHKINWNYMILDEAQAIKNINSQRWNTLLSFHCRNRLLLTGTPIQNSMSELWALLHFIMPNLFDSHEQFKEWFSKDIEAHSQDKGELNKEQLKRLHQILKPFMLRRVKKDVEHEIGPKEEFEIACEMTEKQKILYNSIKEKLSNISDLFISTDSKFKVTNLMNLVMQFRKVCNHPELFERSIGKVPFTFKDLVSEHFSNSMFVLLNGDVHLRINNKSVVNYFVPKMIYDLCYELYDIGNKKIKNKMFNIFRYENIVDSLYFRNGNSIFNFVNLIGISFREIDLFMKKDLLINQICILHYFKTLFRINQYKNEYNNNNDFDDNKKTLIKINLFINKNLFSTEFNEEFSIKDPKTFEILPPLIINNIISRKNKIPFQLIKHRCYIPKAISFTPEILCSNNQLQKEQNLYKNNLIINKILYGINFNQYHSNFNTKISQISRVFSFSLYNNTNNENNQIENGLLTPLFNIIEGFTQIELPSFERLINNCAKLKKLDEILAKLYKENHRVLIFCQMTHMIDILEEYMTKRKYTYFRMDGSTQIMDRRDMINEFQKNDKIFAFLLSTRAGGLGVNLTAADTVIFYDNDWNPTMDAQATDRVHRIGQKKKVYVYRLITAGTIEERILKRAKQKQNVQTTVYSGGAFKADVFKQNDIVELLYSEEEMKKMELEKKKLLLEINKTGNNNNNVGNNGDFDNDGLSDDAGNNFGGFINNSSKGKNKKKNKKQIKSGKKIIGKKKKDNNNNNNIDSSTNSNSNKSINNNNNKNINNEINKNIFDAPIKHKKKLRENEINIDSSDEENKIIIDDGIHSINLEDENDDDNMNIDN